MLVIRVRAVSGAGTVRERGTVPVNFVCSTVTLLYTWMYYKGTEYVFVEGDHDFVLYLEQFFSAGNIFYAFYIYIFLCLEGP